jgi:hypothetical protein
MKATDKNLNRSVLFGEEGDNLFNIRYRKFMTIYRPAYMAICGSSQYSDRREKKIVKNGQDFKSEGDGLV